MCGIFCCTSQSVSTEAVLGGLQRLEYRGYDSAGLAWLEGGKLESLKSTKRVDHLISLAKENDVRAQVVLGHTRWATHGPCDLVNAHPHISNDSLAVVHNGIIENFLEIKVDLQNLGYKFQSSTDTEVLAHLLHHLYQETKDPLKALTQCLNRIEGSYAFVVYFKDQPQKLFGVCNGSPLVIGLNKEALYFSSDIVTLTSVTEKIIRLEEGSIFVGEGVDTYAMYDLSGQSRPFEVVKTKLSKQINDLGIYHSYTEKEIFEQPQAIIDTMAGRVGKEGIVEDLCGAGSAELLREIDEIQIVGCGSSYHAGMVAQSWFEQIACVPCRVDIASEYNSRAPIVRGKALLIVISQSGETADTIAAVRKAKALNYVASLCLSNVKGSALTRLCDLNLYTEAGPEIGVATTKALTTQMQCLLMLATLLAQLRGENEKMVKLAIEGLTTLPQNISLALELSDEVNDLCHEIASKEHVIFLGKGIHFPIAMEGSLKLKELSYIHAEAYAAGELKHGPLALIDYRMSVIAIAPNNELLSKLKNNLNEVRARHGRLIVFADQNVSLEGSYGKEELIIHLNAPNPLTSPIVYTIPLQLLAWHVSINLGHDVDKPKNLAKSVTVE